MHRLGRGHQLRQHRQGGERDHQAGMEPVLIPIFPPGWAAAAGGGAQGSGTRLRTARSVRRSRRTISVRSPSTITNEPNLGQF
jgi:hypothetical protein